LSTNDPFMEMSRRPPTHPYYDAENVDLDGPL
jgi:hypothetical protein